MIRAVFASAFVAVLTIACSMAGLASGLWDRSGDTVVAIAGWWGRRLLQAAGVRLSVEVRGHLDASRPYVFVCNHLSAMDIWVLLSAVPHTVRFIAKKQLSYIPFLGWVMWVGRYIFIDRKNAVKARKSIEKAKGRIRAGSSVVLFPEGTRSRDGRLLPFKKGSVHLALDAGVPLVPMAIWGTFAAMPRGSLLVRRGHVRLVIGEPIETVDLSAEDRHTLNDRVREQVAAMVDELSVHDANQGQAMGGGGHSGPGAIA